MVLTIPYLRQTNKGVVSAIIPDDQMPMTEDGTQRAEVCLNVLGVHSRMNPAQSYEHELNFFAQEIVTKYKDNEKELFKNIMKFYKIASPDQYSFLNEELKTTTDKNNFCKDIIANGVYIFQQPFSDNISVDSNLELHSTFKIPKKKFKNIYDPLVIADMYYIKLKHEAMGKLSIRSSGPISLLNVPYRNNDAYKKGNSLFSNSAIKLGEQELFNLLLLNNEKSVFSFLKSYSSSELLRTKMIDTLFKNDVNNIEKFNSEEDEQVSSNAADTVKALFSGMGISLENVNGNLNLTVEDLDSDGE